MSEEIEEFIEEVSDDVGIREDQVEEVFDKVLGFMMKKRVENVRENSDGFTIGTDDYEYNE